MSDIEVKDSVKAEASEMTVDNMPQIKEFEGIGELTVGGNIGLGDTTRILFTALCLINDPHVNEFFLANKVNISDRITKTQIFPREGMLLEQNKTYTSSSGQEENKENA